jgi:hypothetical protein
VQSHAEADLSKVLCAANAVRAMMPVVLHEQLQHSCGTAAAQQYLHTIALCIFSATCLCHFITQIAFASHPNNATLHSQLQVCNIILHSNIMKPSEGGTPGPGFDPASLLESILHLLIGHHTWSYVD